MDVSEIEPNQNIIYITEGENKLEWTFESTKDLLKIYDENSDLLDTGIIPTQKRLWQLTSKAMLKKGYSYTAAQCENKWKTLKRSYKTKLERVQKFGSTKRSCPFEYEIAEIISKRPNDNFSRSYSVKIDEIKRQEDLFKINLNEPPGFTNDNTVTLNSSYSRDMNFVEESTENFASSKTTLSSEPTYVIQETNQTALIEELSDLKRSIVKNNKINSHTLKEANEIQVKILDCLERTLEEKAEIRKIEEKKIKQQSEVVEQMRIQNELLEKLIEKMTQP